MLTEYVGPGDYQLPPRMDAKLRAIPIKNLFRHHVLDVGCDHGFWCKYALANGAMRVVGIDRGRNVRDVGFVNLADFCRQTIKDKRASFVEADVGLQYPQFQNKFDVVFLFSLYHHIFASTGKDHAPIWYWLWRQMTPGGVLYWENPCSLRDPVAKGLGFTDDEYNPEIILDNAEKFFELQFSGPAVHEPDRTVLVMAARPSSVTQIYGQMQAGAGGATKAFQYKENRRIEEIEKVTGVKCIPGSLNVHVSLDFYKRANYFRAQILDVVNRSAGLDSEWAPRWARFYPVEVQGVDAQVFAFRFEGEKYPDNFVELISNRHLRSEIAGQEAMLWID